MQQTLRKIFVFLVTTTALSGVGFGIYKAVKSPLFLVQVVEVADQPEEAPVDAQKITELAAVPVGSVNLFELNLSEVEKRILVNPWIREVRLQKRFPQTLSVSIVYREPKALFQAAGGSLAYVDSDGKIFGQVDLNKYPDLPLMTGFHSDQPKRIAEALSLLSKWESSPLSRYLQVSSLTWDAERGFRLLIAYPVGVKSLAIQASNSNQKNAEPVKKARAYVDLGQEIDDGVDIQLKRLANVFQYLSENSIQTNQIWADSGKKIVVRTAHGS